MDLYVINLRENRWPLFHIHHEISFCALQPHPFTVSGFFFVSKSNFSIITIGDSNASDANNATKTVII